MSALRQTEEPLAPSAPVVLAPRVGGGVWTATARAVYVIWYRDVIRFTRDRVRLLISLVQPLLYLLVFGQGLASSLGSRGIGAGGATGSIGYVHFMFPGVVGMAILFTAIFTAMSIVWDREFGFLREILVAPINRSAVAIGKALGGATQAMVQGVVMLAFAPVVGVHPSLLSILEVLPVLFVLAFSLSAMGVAVSARMRSMQGFQMVMNLLMMPMFFLGGSLFPLNSLPAWLTVLTRLDPVAYGIAPVRHILLGGTGVPGPVLDQIAAVSIAGHPIGVVGEVALLLAFGFVMLGLGVHGFRRRD